MGKTGALTSDVFFRLVPDDEPARNLLEQWRWGKTPACPKCERTDQQYKQKRDGKEGYYRCKHCVSVYTVRTGTIMQRSHVPLHLWLYALNCVVFKVSPSLIQPFGFSRKLGITPTTAGLMLRRIYEAKRTREFQEGWLLKGIVNYVETTSKNVNQGDELRQPDNGQAKKAGSRTLDQKQKFVPAKEMTWEETMEWWEKVRPKVSPRLRGHFLRLLLDSRDKSDLNR